MNFRENLKYLMDFKNIQTKELSKLSGISENTIKSYLKEASPYARAVATIFYIRGGNALWQPNQISWIPLRILTAVCL